MLRLSIHSSSGIAAEDGRMTRAAPALFTRMSRPPSLESASCATFCAPSSVRVSPATNSAPLGVSAWVLRAVTTTVAPPSSRRCAVAAPMPREPPVIRARLSTNSFVRSSLYLDMVFFLLSLGYELPGIVHDSDCLFRNMTRKSWDQHQQGVFLGQQ